MTRVVGSVCAAYGGSVEGEECQRLFGTRRVARLATVDTDGGPHIVPIVFVLLGDDVFTAVDDKPKRTRALKRLANLRANPHAAVLADQYVERWEDLWWVRGDATGEILPADSPDGLRALEQLVAKYPQYERARPQGPVIRLRVERWSGWRATQPDRIVTPDDLADPPPWSDED